MFDFIKKPRFSVKMFKRRGKTVTEVTVEELFMMIKQDLDLLNIKVDRLLHRKDRTTDKPLPKPMDVHTPVDLSGKPLEE